MLRVMRNHARAAYGEDSGYEDLSIAPVPLDHAALKDEALGVMPAPPGTARSSSASCMAIATRR